MTWQWRSGRGRVGWRVESGRGDGVGGEVDGEPNVVMEATGAVEAVTGRRRRRLVRPVTEETVAGALLFQSYYLPYYLVLPFYLHG